MSWMRSFARAHWPALRLIAGLVAVGLLSSTCSDGDNANIGASTIECRTWKGSRLATEFVPSLRLEDVGAEWDRAARGSVSVRIFLRVSNGTADQVAFFPLLTLVGSDKLDIETAKAGAATLSGFQTDEFGYTIHAFDGDLSKLDTVRVVLGPKPW